METQNQNEKDKVLLFLESLEKNPFLQDDDDIDRKLGEDLFIRSRAYNKILSHYEESIGFNLKSKHACKIATFSVSLLILVITVIGFFVMFVKCSSFPLLTDRLTVIIPLIISFLTVFIVIPKIITEYLFNKNEEKYMMQLLENMLKFDIRMKENIDKHD